MSKELRKMLDIDPMDTDNTINFNDKEVLDDFDLSRKTMKDLLCKSSEVLEDMIDLARTSQAPRAYEVLNQIFKRHSNQIIYALPAFVFSLRSFRCMVNNILVFSLSKVANNTSPSFTFKFKISSANGSSKYFSMARCKGRAPN